MKSNLFDQIKFDKKRIDTLWRINKINIDKLLNENNLNGNLYKPFGDYFLVEVKCETEFTIVLGNITNELFSYPINYISIAEYNNGYIFIKS